MDQFIPLSQYVSYMLYAYLVGYVVLQFVPQTNKPSINVSKRSLLLSILAIIILTFLPVIQVITFFATDGVFSLTAYSILTEFQIGIAWLYGSFFAILLWMTIYVNGSKYVQATFLLIMILAVGYSSHASSLNLWSGLFSHSIHFLVVTIWVGVLLHVVWIGKETTNWYGFLKWFTPLSICLVIITIVTGVLLMLFVMKPADYFDSWVLTYGQVLLLKHISIVPIMAFAFINGFLVKKTKLSSDFNPLKWVQAETVILMIVFFITGILGTLPPPHQVNTTLLQEGPAFWIEGLIGQKIQAPFHVQLVASFEGILLFIIGILFLSMIIMSFYKKANPYLALGFGLAFILATYIGLMFSIGIQ
ncbi:copper resistance D family protein [Metabacillus sp. HB246100]